MVLTSSSTLPPDEIYAASLQTLYLGRPMWYPEPHQTGEPQIGDVGFVEEGAFVRLFNIHKRKAGKYWPVPYKNTNPFPKKSLRVDVRSGALAPRAYRSHGVESSGISAGADVAAGAGVPAGVSAEYECRGATGAVLVLQSEARSERLVEHDGLQQYILQRHDGWYRYATQGLERPMRQTDLVVVCGWGKTAADWAAAAFGNSSTRGKVAATAEAAGLAGAHIALSSASPTSGPVVCRQGRRFVKESQGAEGAPPDEASPSSSPGPDCDQRVFLRRYKLRKRFLFMRKIVAHAGYHRLPDGRDESGTAGEGITDAATSPFQQLGLGARGSARDRHHEAHHKRRRRTACLERLAIAWNRWRRRSPYLIDSTHSVDEVSLVHGRQCDGPDFLEVHSAKQSSIWRATSTSEWLGLACSSRRPDWAHVPLRPFAHPQHSPLRIIMPFKPSAPPPYEIYATSLQSLYLGRPMWYPEPHKAGEPQIGDVGFIEEGAFIKLFNIHESNAGKIWPVPFTNDHLFPKESLCIDSRSGTLAPRPYPSHGVESKGISAGADITAGAGVSVGISADYECRAAAGAVLVLQSEAHSERVFEHEGLKRYILQHHDTWHAYVKNDLQRSMRQSDLIVVSGWVKTTADWAVAAFSKSKTSGRASATAGAVGIAAAHITMSSSSAISGPPSHRHGRLFVEGSRGKESCPRDGASSPSGPSNTDDPTPRRDQSVFLRRYKLRKRWILPRKIVAAAGYHCLPDEQGGDGASGAVGLTAEDEEQDVGYMWHWAGQGGIPDPLDVLLDYMLEVSGAEIVLASDDDVRVITSGRPIVDFASYLRWLQPPVELEDKLGSLRIEDVVRHQTGLSVARRKISYADWAKWPSASQDGSGCTGNLEIFTTRMGNTPVKIPTLLLSPTEQYGMCTDSAHSPDGTLLAAAFYDDGEFLWRVSDGTLLQRHRRGNTFVRCMAFSPQGTEVISGYTDGGAVVWVVASGKKRLDLQVAGPEISAVSYSPDGRYIATGDESGHAKVWDNRTGELQHILSPIGGDTSVFSLAFLPREAPWDLFVHRRNGVSIYDLQSGARHGFGIPNKETIRAVALSQQRNRVALAIGNRTEIWSTEDRKLLLRLKSEEAFTKLGFSPDGKEVSAWGPMNRAVCIFDVSTGAPLREYQLQSDYANTCVYSPNGEFMAISDDDRVLLYDRRSSRHTDYSARFTPARELQVEDMKFLPDNRTLVVRTDRAPLHLIDVYAVLQL